MASDVINQTVRIIREFMKLENDQVTVYNQNWKIPGDKRLYISVGFVSSKPYGSTRAYEESTDRNALLEVITLTTQEVYAVNVFGMDQQVVLDRKDEVSMAFNSTLAEQLMDEYSFKLPRLPISFNDLSALEGASRLCRFEGTFAVLRGRRKENVVQYYDQYPGPNLIINP